MLKIKDNVDLKELEKYGLKPKYDEDTGEIKGFISERTVCRGIYILPFKRRKLKIGFKKNYYNNFILDDEFYFYNDYFSRYFDEDLLYYLINDGLVEKVE